MASVFERIPGVRLRQLRQIIPGVDLSNKDILDYGGNRGNLLEDITEEGLVCSSYTNIDVDKSSLDFFKSNFPSHDAVHYNRYNPVYNTQGEKFIAFPFADNSFDIVFSYSVNTHSSFEDYLFDLKEMIRVTKFNGIICTSVITKDFLQLIHQKRINDYGSAIDFDMLANPAEVHYFIDNNVVSYTYNEIPSSTKFLITYYNLDWLQERLLAENISTKYVAPEHPWLQGTIVIEK